MCWRADSFCCGMFTRPELPASVPSSRYSEIAEGMSLIELLIVCAVMSVLVGMAVPSLVGHTGRLVGESSGPLCCWSRNAGARPGRTPRGSRWSPL